MRPLHYFARMCAVGCKRSPRNTRKMLRYGARYERLKRRRSWQSLPAETLRRGRKKTDERDSVRSERQSFALTGVHERKPRDDVDCASVIPATVCLHGLISHHLSFIHDWACRVVDGARDVPSGYRQASV